MDNGEIKRVETHLLGCTEDDFHKSIELDGNLYNITPAYYRRRTFKDGVFTTEISLAHQPGFEHVPEFHEKIL